MAKEDKYWNNPVDLNVDWGGDAEKTEGKPLSGRAVQDTIKNALNSKVGYVGYCATTKMNVLTKDEASFIEYDRLIQEDNADEANQYKIGEFKAMASHVITITVTDPETYTMSVLNGTTGVTVSFSAFTKEDGGSQLAEGYTYKITNPSKPNEYIGDSMALDNANATVNIDKLLSVGNNSIVITVTGNDSDISAFKTVNVKVINLQITDTFNISTVYDFSSVTTNEMVVPYSVITNAPTTIHWFIDGKELEDKRVTYSSNVPSASMSYTLNHGDLTNGVHTLMYYAEYNDNTTAEPFRTNISYRNFFVRDANYQQETHPWFSFSFDMPYSEDFINNKLEPTYYGIKQYDNIPFVFAIDTFRGNEEVEIQVKEPNAKEYRTYRKIEVEAKTVVKQTITIETEGIASIKLVSGESSSDEFEITISKNDIVKPPRTTNLLLNLTARGKMNKGEGYNEWVSTVDGKTYKAKLEGFQWNKNSGWGENALIIRDGSSVEIPFYPFNDKSNYTEGFTFEFEFTTTNVYNENGEICNITNYDGDSGIVITASEAIFRVGGGAKVSTKYKSGKTYRIAFVKTRTGDQGTLENQRFVKIYVNGVLCGIEEFSYGTSFANASPIKIIGTKDATIELTDITFYNSELDDDEILNNYMFYRTDSNKKTELYSENNIYDENGNIDIAKLNQQLPVMIFYQIEDRKGQQQGELHKDLELEFSDKGKTIWMDIKYTNLNDPDGKYDFYWKNAGVRPQGTSSMKYPKKNYRIYTQRDSENIDLGPTEMYVGEEYKKYEKYLENGGENTAVSPEKKKRKYQFKDGAAKVKCWCLKADFAESSGTHNTGVARYWNQVLTGSGFKTNAQLTAERENYKYDVRTTVDGFPIALFYKPLGKDIQFLGKYNFNNDKSTEDVFGFTGGDEIDSKTTKYVKIGYNKPVIQSEEDDNGVKVPVAEIFNKNKVFNIEDENGNIVEQFTGEEVFNNPTIHEDLEAPLYYEEVLNNGKTLYYKLETSEMFDNARMECWELLNSGTDLALFRRKMTGDPKKDLGDSDEKVGYIGADGKFQESFESRFPDCAETYHTYNLQRLIEWLYDCMYLKSEIVEEVDEKGNPTGNIKGKYIPMTEQELKTALGNDYKSTITIGLKTLPTDKDTFKFVSLNEDGSTIGYKTITWDEIKNDVLDTEEDEEGGVIFEKTIEEYRLIDITDSEASNFTFTEKAALPMDEKGKHIKEEKYIKLKDVDENNVVTYHYYIWGYTKVYYIYDYTKLKEEVTGYNYVFDIKPNVDDAYYTWGDFLYFKDFIVEKEYPNTPANRALKFAVEKYDHFKLEMMAAYYIYLMRFGGVDQTVKNAMLTTEGSDDNSNIDLPSKWYFINYDNDTVMGVKNDGRLVFDPYITRDSIENNQIDEEGNAAYCYAGRNSTMWNNLEMDLDFMELVPTVDDKLQKNSNTLSYSDAINMFNNEQSGKWCERVYNLDAQVKYINTFTNREGEDLKDDEGNKLASFDYLLNVQGPRLAHREWWLSKRFNIFDSKYTTGSFKRDVVTFKCNGPSKQDDKCPITSGEDIYYGYYKNNPSSYYKTDTTIKPGNTWELTVTANSTIGDPHAIFGSPNIEKIDFRNIAYRITELQMTGIKSAQIGTKLKELLIGNHSNPKLNHNFSVLGAVDMMEKLEVLDLTGCQEMKLNDTQTGKLMNLKELYLAGTSTQDISFINGGDITIMELPFGLNSLSLVDTTNLIWDNLKFFEMTGNANNPSKIEFSGLSPKLSRVSIKGCPNLLNDHNIFLTWLEKRYETMGYLSGTELELDTIEWYLSAEEVSKLMILKEMSKDSISLKGKIYINAKLSLEQVRILSSMFDSCFVKGASLEIIALPGIYVTKFGNGKDYILEGDEMTNQYEIVIIGVNDTITSVEPSIFETDENGFTESAKEGIIWDVNDKNIINLNVIELIRTVTQINISAMITIENEYGDVSRLDADEDLTVDVVKRTYPTKGVIKCIEGNRETDRKSIGTVEPYTFELILTDNDGNRDFNGNIEDIEWELSGEAYNKGIINFVSEDEPRRCKIQATKLDNTFFNLTARVYRKVQGQKIPVIGDVTNKDMIVKNDEILLTAPENPALYKLLDDYGFIDQENYLSKTYAKKLELDSVGNGSNVKFKDIFRDYKGYKNDPNDNTETVLFTDFSIFENFTSIASVGDDMFKSCSNLKTLVLPPNVQSIGNGAFEGCSNLNMFDMPKVRTIGDRAFYSCTSFTNIVIPNNVNKLGAYAFYGCTSLKSITLSNGITEISNNLFDGCGQLEKVIYGDITKIGDFAFKECYLLEKLNIPETLTTIVVSDVNNPFAKAYKVIFEGGNDIYSVVDGTLYYNDAANNKKVIIRQNPNNAIAEDEELSAVAYSLCGMVVKKLTIPTNVTFEGNNILNGSKGDSIRLTKRFEEHVKYEELLSETMYNEYKFHENETSIPTKCFMNSDSSFIQIPDGIKEIGEQAFYGCDGITSIVVPSSVEKLHFDPFHTMSKLTTITFDGVVPPVRVANTSGTKSILSKLGDVTIKVAGDSLEDYEYAWPDYKEILKADSLPSEGNIRVVVDGEIYNGTDVTVGGMVATKQNNGYYKFTTSDRITDISIKINGKKVGEYTNNYMSVYENTKTDGTNSNIGLYSTSGRGIDFTRGIINWNDVKDTYFKAFGTNWAYNSTLKALKSAKVGNSEYTMIQLLKPESFVEDGYVTMIMGQASEDGYDYFVIYEMDGNEMPIVRETTPLEIDIVELKNNASLNNKTVGKSKDGLKYVRSNYIKVRFKYTEGKKYYFTYTKDSGSEYFSDACWIYSIGNPVFIEPTLDDAYVEEFTIKVNEITGSGANKLPEQGVKVRIWNDTYFDQYFLLDNEGKVNVRLPKNETYHVDADDYMIGNKPYYYKDKSLEIKTDGSMSNREISLEYEYLWEEYVVDVNGERYTGTNAQDKIVAYYIYADSENDYYVYPNLTSSVWSSVNGSSGVNEMFVSGYDDLYKLYEDDYRIGYENTAKIRKYFTGNDITTVATQANNKFEYRDVIDWYIPSVEEMQKLMDSSIWGILSKNFNDKTILWTSNLANKDNAWVYKHEYRDNIDDAFRTHSKSASANIMFFGKIKI